MLSERVKERLFSFLSETSVIERDVFEYGYKVFTHYAVCFFNFFPISVCLGTINETFVFMLSLLPLRRYMGSYHFNNAILCSVTSTIIIILIPLISHYIALNYYIVTVVSLIAFTLTSIIKSKDHSNKPLSVDEKKFYTRKALVLQILYWVLIIISLSLNFHITVNNIFLSVVLSLIGILI